MKVLMISEYFYPSGKGGGEISSLLLAKELAKTGIEMHVLTSKFSNAKEEEVYEGIKIHRKLKTGENPSSLVDNIKRRLFFEKSLLRELLQLDHSENFDIIHCMNVTSISAVKLKDKIKKRFILHVNSPILFCPKGTLIYKDKEPCIKNCTRLTFLDCYNKSSLIGKFEPSFFAKYNPFYIYIYRKRYEEFNRLMPQFDHFIAISKFMEENLLRQKISRNKISVVYNIVELERFKDLKKPKNKIKKILYLGEYSKPKGPHLLIEALKKIKLPYEANFYGDGVLKSYLKEESKKFGLNVNVNDKLDYKDIPKIMQMHDIVVVPSIVGEAFGRVALEAVAAGKIVIASDVGGIKEITKNRLCNLNNKNQLIKLINNALHSKSLENINIKFSKKKTIDKMLKIYEVN